MKRKLIVANWKMNFAFDETDEWIKNFIAQYNANYTAMQNVEVAVCPPTYLISYLDAELLETSFFDIEQFLKAENKKVEDFSQDELMQIMIDATPFFLGAQDCHYENSGAFTGDTSPMMLSEMGVRYVILGHSERRAQHFETNEIVAKKARAALYNDIIPIICVGESKETRDAEEHLKFVFKQLIASIPQDVIFPRLVIAYEPIWSIGTGLVPTSEQILEMMDLIKKICKEKISNLADEFVLLYGGSATEVNAAEILSIQNVDGLLVGKASLDGNKFAKICLSV